MKENRKFKKRWQDQEYSKQGEKVKVKSKMRKNTVYWTIPQYALREGVGFKRQEKWPGIRSVSILPIKCGWQTPGSSRHLFSGWRGQKYFPNNIICTGDAEAMVSKGADALETWTWADTPNCTIHIVFITTTHSVFFKFLIIEYKVIILCDKMGSMHKARLLYTKEQILLKERHL